MSSRAMRAASKLPDLNQAEFPHPVDVYDLIVIGSGPGGESLAVRASQLGAKVAVIERKAKFGGASGLTSKAVREATKRLTRAVDQIGGDRRRQIQGLWKRRYPALLSEAQVLQAAETRTRLTKNNVDLYVGQANFVNTNGIGLEIYDDDNDDNDDEEDTSIDNRSTEEKSLTTLRVCRPSQCVDLVAKTVCIATGSRPNRPKIMRQRVSGDSKEMHPDVPVPFRKNVIVDATEMGTLKDIPKAAAVIGGGVIAVEYATVLAELGVGVSLICPEESFMPFLDEELRIELKRALKRDHVLLVHEPLNAIKIEQGMDKDGKEITKSRISLVPRVFTKRKDGEEVIRVMPERKLLVDLVLYSGGRDANSGGLTLENVAVETSKYGRIIVDPSSYKTTSFDNVGQHIYAIGDVMGGGLASTAAQQGRELAERLFDSSTRTNPSNDNDGNAGFNENNDDDCTLENVVDDDFFSLDNEEYGDDHLHDTLFGDQKGSHSMDAPLTLWTIPEIASCGYTSEQARAKAANSACLNSIVEGRAYFRDTARGRLVGDENGFLKVIAWKANASAKYHTIIGVQILGEGANELIQMGSILIHSLASIEQVSKTPFAAVTLSGLFQVACDDALLAVKKRAN